MRTPRATRLSRCPERHRSDLRQLDAGEEIAAISLDREVFEGGIAHEDGAVTLQLGGVEFVIGRRE
jgi:hypothetical protein